MLDSIQGPFAFRLSSRLRERCGGESCNSTGQTVYGSFAIRMHAIAKEDKKQLLFRVDPQNRSGEAAMSKRLVTEQIAAIG